MTRDDTFLEELARDAEAELRSLELYERWLRRYCAEHPERSSVCREAFEMLEEKKAKWRKVLMKIKNSRPSTGKVRV